MQMAWRDVDVIAGALPLGVDGEAGTSGDDLYKLGLSYSTGQGAPLDYVEAHKWFNLAAMRGYPEAKVYRKELADQMSAAEIASAQKSAREWLSAQA